MAWGSREILGRMRGVPVPTEQPEAEVWVGAHPAAPSRATVDGTESPLNELIVENPSRFLRPDRISDWFPFLFKILAIDAPLSIQVHPTPEQAIAGSRTSRHAASRLTRRTATTRTATPSPKPSSR